MAASVISSLTLKPAPASLERLHVKGIPSLAGRPSSSSSSPFKVQASGKKLKTDKPYGQSILDLAQNMLSLFVHAYKSEHSLLIWSTSFAGISGGMNLPSGLDASGRKQKVHIRKILWYIFNLKNNSDLFIESRSRERVFTSSWTSMVQTSTATGIFTRVLFLFYLFF